MSKAEEFTKEKGGVVNIHIEPNDDVYIRQDDVYRLMQAYAEQEVNEYVQQELERWKNLYQTEFNKPKLKQE